MPKTTKDLMDKYRKLIIERNDLFPSESNMIYIKLLLELSKREFEIAIELMQNSNYEKIAKKLSITTQTVRKHARNIFQKAAIKSVEEFQIKYPFLLDLIKVEIDYPQLEKNKTDAIDMKWEDQNAFEAYFEEFSNVIQAMHQLDFSKRLYESNEKDSFFNFVAQSINLVNEELQQNFVPSEIIPKLMNSLSAKNRIVLLSLDKNCVSHAFSTIQNEFIDADKFIGLTIEEFLDTRHAANLKKEDSSHFTADINPKIFPDYVEREARFEIEHGTNFTLLSITIIAENRFSEQLPRILSLLSCIKSQYDDNPTLSNSILGATISIEVNSIYAELSSYFIRDN